MSLLPPSPSSPNPRPTAPAKPAYDVGAAGSMQAANNNNAGFDLLGPLQRRKYLVVLFCLIGAGLGYLQFIKTPKTYSSATRLLISTQAPPTIIDGDLRMNKVSLSKHASMIASEMVLSSASQQGQFDRMTTFNDTSFPVSKLKSMVTVSPEGAGNETLIIACQGPDADELPSILSQITNAYKKIVIEDDQVGQEAIELIQKLASQVTDEKDDVEAQRLKLWNDLGIQSTDANGTVINPFHNQLSTLQSLASQLNQQLTETQERAKLLRSSLQADPETGVIDPINVKVAAIEAQDYMKLSRSEFKEEERGGGQVVRSLQNELGERQTLTNRIWGLKTTIDDLTFQKSQMMTTLGSGHKRVVTLQEQIDYKEKERAEYQAQLNEIEKFIDQQTELANARLEPSEEAETPAIDLATFRANEDREWINMYQTALANEQKRLSSNLERTNAQIKEVSQKAEQVAGGIVQLNLLQRKIDEKGQAINVISDRLKEMNLLANNYNMTKVKILDPPKRGRVIAPSLPKSVALGTMLAFLAGLGLAILVDRSEMAFRNPHEIFSRLQVPVVGRIPRINVRKIQPERGHASLVCVHKPNATASEAFRDVRTGLFFKANVDDLKTILFTSPSPGDGKSTTIGNMAVSIAQAGKRVILVDADFRRPRVHQYFGEEL
ncbi:MAG: hypothetical protein AAF623_21365, partial [Planctomycetota bacterium]